MQAIDLEKHLDQNVVNALHISLGGFGGRWSHPRSTPRTSVAPGNTSSSNLAVLGDHRSQNSPQTPSREYRQRLYKTGLISRIHSSVYDQETRIWTSTIFIDKDGESLYFTEGRPRKNEAIEAAARAALIYFGEVANQV